MVQLFEENSCNSIKCREKKWQDLLDFGDGKKIKKMKIAKWDVAKDTVDLHSLIPKI